MDYAAQLVKDKRETSDALNRVEAMLHETTDIGSETAEKLVAQGEQLGAIKIGLNQVKDDITRTHKLLDKFAQWANCGCGGKKKSRKAGKRGQMKQETEAVFKQSQARKNGTKNVAIATSDDETSFEDESFGPTGIKSKKGPQLGEKYARKLRDVQKLDYSQPSASVEEPDEHDEQLDRISGMVANLNKLAKDIETEVTKQSGILGEVGEDIDVQLREGRNATARSTWHVKKYG